MFESDDFDQVLSQFDFPDCKSATEKRAEVPNASLLQVINQKTLNKQKHISVCNENNKSFIDIPNNNDLLNVLPSETVLSNDKHSSCLDSVSVKAFNSSNKVPESSVCSKHTKRKLLTSLFDHKNKRKFPGPAGLLSGTFEESKDENLGQIELLSQDVDFSQNNYRSDLFESSLWKKLLIDVKSWNLGTLESINTIKHQALSGNLKHGKAQVVTAFVETVDRSVTDPLITLRDNSGSIKCTLHRDAWANFSSYIVAEYCAFVLFKPTVLTTGGAFKKHYLNITPGNIFAIFSSASIDEDKAVINNYRIIFENNITVLKNNTHPNEIGSNSSINDSSNNWLVDDGLESIFFDEIF